MRKITRETVEAFVAGKTRTVGNTSTNGKVLRLHGNLIAERMPDGGVYATLAGWGSPTTRERLNGLVCILGLKGRFTQSKHVQHFRDRPISATEIIVLVRPEKEGYNG